MKRAITTIGTTIAALALLFQFETKEPLAAAVTTLVSTTQVEAGGAPSTTTSPTSSTTTSSTSTTSTTSTTTTTIPTTTTTAVSQSVDITGPAVPTRWGTVQVEVVVEGGRLVDVVGVQLPNERQYSAYVSSVAGPWLRDEALAAQSAHIQNISGATYTSQGYARSLQGALDTAGL
jgi:uncharacterized protein with FMN-binding domain